MSTSLGDELRRLRKDKGITLEEAANGVGITLQYMSLLEKGQRKSVSFEIMTNISRFYGVPLDYFAMFLNEEGEEVTPLSEQEIEVWNQINQQAQEEIYYKNGNKMKTWIMSLFKSNPDK